MKYYSLFFVMWPLVGMTTFECIDKISVSLPTKDHVSSRICINLYSSTLIYLLERIKTTGADPEFIHEFLANYTKDTHTINIVTAKLATADLS